MRPLCPRPFAPIVAAFAALGLVVSTAPPTAAQARPLLNVCEDPPTAGYDDRDEIAAAHGEAVDCLTELGVTQGYAYDEGMRYLPDGEVIRGQMATFIVGMLRAADVELPTPSDQGFEDVTDDDVHADSIRQLAEIDIVDGVSEDRYAPHELVTRDQMASFLIRAAAFQAGVEREDLQGGEEPFTDVPADATHAPAVAGAYHLGITSGVDADHYAPDRTVRRGAMASFIARTLDAMEARQTVSDRDRGALAHTVYTFLSESGRCFQVKAGDAWVPSCDPGTDETLQTYTITVDDGFAVVAGLVTSEVTRVVVEYDDSETIELDLVDTRSEGLRAWASPILREHIDAVVAYDGDEELARISPDDEAGGVPFQADTRPSSGTGSGEPVTVTDIRVAHHQTYDRTVFDLAGDGLPGWEAEYVEQATHQSSGAEIELLGDAVIELSLTNVVYPPGDNRHPQGEVEGVDTVREVHLGNVFEAVSQAFIGVETRTPFRVFTLQDPQRLVVDVVHPEAG